MLTAILNVVLFLALAASSLYLWRRRRDAATAWLACAWGSLGLAVLVSFLIPDATGDTTGALAWATKLGVLLPIIWYPYCLVRFAASFDRRRALTQLAGALTLVVILITLAVPYLPADSAEAKPWWSSVFTGAFFVQWVGLSLVAALRLWWAGRKEPSVTRRRMQLLSIGAATLSIVILLPLLDQSSSVVIRVLSTVLVFSTAAFVLVGLTPPAWLRMIWRRKEHNRIYALQHAMIGARSRDELAAAVLPVLTGLLGCEAAAMLDRDGRVVASHGAAGEVADLVDTTERPGAVAGVPRTDVARVTLQSGALLAQAGRYAPVLGTDELRLFESVALMVDAALGRIENLEQLAHAHERALEASRLKSEFLANMSHEIRTPINGVIGLTELLARTELDEEQRAYTATIQSSADALLSVLNDILDFSKIEAGKLDLNLTDFDVRSAVEDIVALLAGAANGKHIELAMAVEDGVPAALRGDVGRLRQVLLNLAGNAVKFTETGEVVIRVSRAAGAADGGPGTRCRFEVTDSGPGIPADAVAALFDSFSQADPSSTRRHGGTGLGLAISKRLVELMGGTIGLETELGQGSVFWFEIELEPASAGWVAAPPVSVLRGKTVLVVDDNVTNRTILLQTAKAWQLDAVAVPDVEEALAELARRHQRGERFDLAWIDHQMPGRNGSDLAREMAADERFRDTARILLTSSGDRSGVDSGEIHAHLTKPVRPSVLLDCVVHLLARAEAGAPHSEVATPAPRPEPTRATPPLAETGPSTSGPVDTQPAAGGPSVLVAEDNPVSQQVARRMLESLGCSVEIARTGQEALAAARQHNYDLIFMDCQMPEVDGYEATATLRSQEGASRHTPVVALTASAMKGDAERCFEAGMDDYLTKPVRIADFGAALSRWLPLTAPDAPDPSTGPESGRGPAVELAALSALTEDEDQAADLVGLFVSTTSAQVLELRASAGDAASMRRLAHAVRGGALSLGAAELARRCQQVELDAAHGSPVPTAQLEAVEDEFARVRELLLERFPAARGEALAGARPAC